MSNEKLVLRTLWSLAVIAAAFYLAIAYAPWWLFLLILAAPAVTE